MADGSGGGSSDFFRLKWNGHNEQAAKRYYEYYKNGSYTDMMLECEGTVRRCHRMVLASASPYFAGLIDNSECEQPLIVLKGVQSRVADAILEFMYKGEAEVRKDDLNDVVENATYFKIRGLMPKDDGKDDEPTTSSQSQQQEQQQQAPPPQQLQQQQPDAPHNHAEALLKAAAAIEAGISLDYGAKAKVEGSQRQGKSRKGRPKRLRHLTHDYEHGTASATAGHEASPDRADSIGSDQPMDFSQRSGNGLAVTSGAPAPLSARLDRASRVSILDSILHQRERRDTDEGTSGSEPQEVVANGHASPQQERAAEMKASNGPTMASLLDQSVGFDTQERLRHLFMSTLPGTPDWWQNRTAAAAGGTNSAAATAAAAAALSAAGGTSSDMAQHLAQQYAAAFANAGRSSSQDPAATAAATAMAANMAGEAASVGSVSPPASRGSSGRSGRRGSGRPASAQFALDDNGRPLIGPNGKPMVRCEECGKVLADPSSLYRHRKIHTGEKNHVCPFCGRTFIQRYNMRQHLRTHRKNGVSQEMIDALEPDLRDFFLANSRNGTPSRSSESSASGKSPQDQQDQQQEEQEEEEEIAMEEGEEVEVEMHHPPPPALMRRPPSPQAQVS